MNVFRPVPDWVAWDNQGGGIAVGSLAGDGSQDLVVLQVDNPAGQNQGRYRIGRTLDDTGQVTGGWGPWIEVPDWFSHENQGANIALADLDGDGRQELVVAMVDNPEGQNRGLFRVGRRLDEQGNATGGWAPWIEVPDWFSWENQGCGVAVADLDRDGERDLIVFHIDSPVGQNQAFYRVGSDLGDDGVPGGGWGPWLGVPNWFAWENQGGGIAVAELHGTLRLVALMIDNPPQQNAGLYELVDLDHDPATYGSWEVFPFHSGVLAVHAALLPNGKVLFFAGSGSSATRFNSPIFGDEGQGIFTSVVWTPPDNSFTHPPTLRTPDQRPYDLFCGGDGFLADGRMLSAGGTLDYNPFRGRNDTAMFDFRTEQWSFAAAMAQGRWYPTLIPLGDGTILAASGLGEHGDDQPKTTLELYSAATDSWRTRQLAGLPGLPLYAHLFLLADGRVFFSGGRMDDPLDVAACILDLTDEPVTATTVPDLLAPDMRNQSASVLLPPAQDQRVMIVGGGPVGIPDKTDGVDAVSIVDLTTPNPAYQAGTPIGLPRLHLNAVLLPDRTVFVSGGSLKQEDEPLARLQAELYDPATDSWSLMATATVPRLYHSTALLLADGRVVAAGGNPEGGDQVPWEPPSPVEELRREVFSPPYLFKGPRPVIGPVAQEWAYGQTVNIPSPQAPGIRWASLVKNGVTTHSFDSGQRLVDAEIVARANDALQVTVTSSPNLAPPGWYMLFLVDQQGVPSIATWIHLT